MGPIYAVRSANAKIREKFGEEIDLDHGYLLYEMQNRKALVGLAALYVGGGMGFAQIVDWYF
jgi:hypothetical protein